MIRILVYYIEYYSWMYVYVKKFVELYIEISSYENKSHILF